MTHTLPATRKRYLSPSILRAYLDAGWLDSVRFFTPGASPDDARAGGDLTEILAKLDSDALPQPARHGATRQFTRTWFGGAGDHSALEAKRLHARLDEALSTLSGIQQPNHYGWGEDLTAQQRAEIDARAAREYCEAADTLAAITADISAALTLTP